MPPAPPSALSPGRRIAVIGSGVAGLTAAYVLQRRHDVTLFEAESRVGGHVNTVHLAGEDGDVAVDTGFIVFNEPNYPGFSRLLARLGVASQRSDMSFSMSCAATQLEYRGTNLNTVFAQRRNLLRPSFLRLLGDIRRFNRDASELIAQDDLTTTLRDFIATQRYGRSFVEHYLLPLGSSVWSADPVQFLGFPAAALARFLHRHGLLELGRVPEWRTIAGGSDRYVARILDRLAGRVRTSTPVTRIERDADGVRLWAPGHDGVRFDEVVIAAHADQALGMLADADDREREMLSAFRFQPNRATLHTDRRLLPRNRRAWASWNFRHVTDPGHREGRRAATLTYHANRLQSLPATTDYCTTLNQDDAIDESTVIASFDFAHPVFDTAAMLAQRRHAEISGRRHTHFAGAYWGYGFHEDGVQSALRVASHFGMSL